MKKIRLILIIFFLLFFVPYMKGQETQVMVVHGNGGVLYINDLTSSDSITFSMVTVPNEGVLIGGVVWATCNVNAPGTFATSPSEFGMFYQWNRRIGWSSTDPMINHEGGTTWDNSVPTGETWETNNDPCPIGWRVPTLTEQQSLTSLGSSWGEINGVSGRFFGYGDYMVFFPAAGSRGNSGGGLVGVGGFGEFWSSMPHPGNSQSNAMLIYDWTAHTGSVGRVRGSSVRCVLE